MRKNSSIPLNFQGILWSKDISKLDIQKNKNYIIHQVLMYGSLKQIDWLETVYTKKEIKNIFIKKPKRIYTPQAFYFVKNYILKVKDSLKENIYVKTSY